MLAPHHREDAELDRARHAAEDVQDVLTSSGSRPCSATMAGADRVAHAVPEQGAEQRQAVGAAELGRDRALGVGHQAQHVALGAQDPGDVGGRAVGVVAIAEGDAVLALEALQAIRIDNVVAVMVCHRQPDRCVAIARGERAGRVTVELDEAADEAQVGIADQRTRQQAGFGQDLEAVVDAEHGGSGLGAPHHLAHHGAVGRHRTATQVVAVGEAAGHPDQVELGSSVSWYRRAARAAERRSPWRRRGRGSQLEPGKVMTAARIKTSPQAGSHHPGPARA